MEIWKPVKDYEDYYEISTLGRLKSFKREYWSGVNFSSKKIQEEFITYGTTHNQGYKVYGLNKNGLYKGVKIHRLVAQAFIPNPDNLPQVNHKDGNKANNKVDNLEWCTPLYNMRHSFETGLNIPSFKKISTNGDNSYTKIINSNIVRNIREEFKKGKTQRQLMDIFKLKRSHINDIVRNKTWKNI